MGMKDYTEDRKAVLDLVAMARALNIEIMECKKRGLMVSVSMSTILTVKVPDDEDQLRMQLGEKEWDKYMSQIRQGQTPDLITDNLVPQIKVHVARDLSFLGSEEVSKDVSSD